MFTVAWFSSENVTECVTSVLAECDCGGVSHLQLIQVILLSVPGVASKFF